MSYNIQVGIATSRRSHYVTGSWKHILPHSQRLPNLDQAANLIRDYDIVGLQELDAGSLRSLYINLAEYLADRAEFPFWYHQVNRNLGHIAQHSNGLLSHFKPSEIIDIKLPGLIPGRQAICAVFDSGEESLALFILHLALSKRARLQQLDYLCAMINEFPHAIVMGDLNTLVCSKEMKLLFDKTGLCAPTEELNTFPSWRPQFHIDHILVSSALEVKSSEVLSHDISDHLPLAMEVILPSGIQLQREEHYQSLSLEHIRKKYRLS
ncbi:MAG: endonuclease/exonuclease/phosphatase family protein [Gammaproteobacteria bacterium]|nr:endonuclease/exonuclease/phosphatase family protein [Gammaproteobacteria bacterium]